MKNTMKIYRIRMVPLALVSIITLSGCSGDMAKSALTNAGNGITNTLNSVVPTSLRSVGGAQAPVGATAAEQRYLERFEKVDFNYATVLEGALLGAGVGCGAGLLIGSGFSDCLKGAAGGAVVGGVAGAVVADGNQKQANAMIDAEKVLVATRQQNDLLRQQNEDMTIVVASLRSEAANIEAQRLASIISAEEAAAQTTALNQRRQAIISATRQAEAEFNANRSQQQAYLAENQRLASATGIYASGTQADQYATDAAGQRVLVAQANTPIVSTTTYTAGTSVDFGEVNRQQANEQQQTEEYVARLSRQVAELENV